MSVLRTNKLREMLRKGEPTVGTHIHSSWPGIVEIIGLSGQIDYVEFTSVYAPFDLYALDNLAMATERYNLSSMIKVDPQPNMFLAQRAIGSGFQSVLFADLRNVAQVEEAIRSVRAEPKGWNGCAMQRLEGYLLECGTANFAKYCDDVVVGVMMEKKSLYDNLEDVMNLDGVDLIQFGPCDFSMSLGVPGQTSHPKVKEAELNVIKTALKYDKHPRIEIESSVGFEDQLKGYMDLGVRDFCIGIDVVILYEWLQKFGGITKRAFGDRPPMVKPVQTRY
jgi:2-keto-3-deoxy-L-rhamnonate aldolase RhmA